MVSKTLVSQTPLKSKKMFSFLKELASYTLHKVTPKKYLPRKIFSLRPRIIASCDLADMSLLSRHNIGYRYILVSIDLFSRFAQVTPLKRCQCSISWFRKDFRFGIFQSFNPWSPGGTFMVQNAYNFSYAHLVRAKETKYK